MRRPILNFAGAVPKYNAWRSRGGVSGISGVVPRRRGVANTLNLTIYVVERCGISAVVLNTDGFLRCIRVIGFSHRDAVSSLGPFVRRLRWSYDAIGPLVALSDGLLTILTSVLGGLLYHLAAFGAFPELDPYFAIGILAMLAYQLIAWNAGLYRITAWLEPQRNYGLILASWFGTFLFLTLFLFLLKLGSEVSRGAVGDVRRVGTLDPGRLAVGGRALGQDRIRGRLNPGAASDADRQCRRTRHGQEPPTAVGVGLDGGRSPRAAA